MNGTTIKTYKITIKDKFPRPVSKENDVKMENLPRITVHWHYPPYFPGLSRLSATHF